MAPATLQGKSVLVTGASSGIGRAAAIRFADAKANVLATGRNADELERLGAECARDAQLHTVAGDLNDARFIADLDARAGELDILVANAGILTYAPLLEMELDDCRAMFETNVLSTFALIQKVARRMVARSSGHIIMVTSVGAREVYNKGGIYCATKHASSAIARGLRLELQGNGIRVSEVAPGVVDTNIRRRNAPAGSASQTLRALQPLTAGEVADAILFAASAPPNCCPDLIELRPRGAAR